MINIKNAKSHGVYTNNKYPILSITNNGNTISEFKKLSGAEIDSDLNKSGLTLNANVQSGYVVYSMGSDGTAALLGKSHVNEVSLSSGGNWMDKGFAMINDFVIFNDITNVNSIVDSSYGLDVSKSNFYVRIREHYAKGSKIIYITVNGRSVDSFETDNYYNYSSIRMTLRRNGNSYLVDIRLYDNHTATSKTYTETLVSDIKNANYFIRPIFGASIGLSGHSYSNRRTLQLITYNANTSYAQLDR